jgi:hypothetical protein
MSITNGLHYRYSFRVYITDEARTRDAYRALFIRTVEVAVRGVADLVAHSL